MAFSILTDSFRARRDGAGALRVSGVVETSSPGWRVSLTDAGDAGAEPGLLSLVLRAEQPAEPAAADLTANDVEYVARGAAAGVARVRIRHDGDGFEIPVGG